MATYHVTQIDINNGADRPPKRNYSSRIDRISRPLTNPTTFPWSIIRSFTPETSKARSCNIKVIPSSQAFGHPRQRISSKSVTGSAHSLCITTQPISHQSYHSQDFPSTILLYPLLGYILWAHDPLRPLTNPLKDGDLFLYPFPSGLDDRPGLVNEVYNASSRCVNYSSTSTCLWLIFDFLLFPFTKTFLRWPKSCFLK